ncbi:MAG: hypothetical protein JXA67_22320 [Micromonosporaceae bacterium]|nr:hypothetical protein [Micromonosporaceae bacterium]
MKALRIHDGQVQTRAVTYRSLPTRQLVTIVATAHIGHPSYFSDVRTYVDQQVENTGAVVHAEGCLSQRPEEHECTPTEWAAVTALVRSQELDRASIAKMPWGWLHQNECLPGPTWTTHDLTALEVVRRIGPEKVLDQQARTQRELKTETEADQQRYASLVAGTFRLAASPLYPLLRRIKRVMDASERVRLDQRNAIALEAALTEPEGRDVVMVWGVGHLSGLAVEMRRRYFLHLPSRDRWLTVGALPRLKLADATAASTA